MEKEKRYYIVFYHVEEVYTVLGGKIKTAHYVRQKTFYDFEKATCWCSRHCKIGYSIVQVSLSDYSLVCTEVERVGGRDGNRN